MINWEQAITTAPYNTLELPFGERPYWNNPTQSNNKFVENIVPDESDPYLSHISYPDIKNIQNPIENIEPFAQGENIKKISKQTDINNPRQSHRVPLGTENNFYDPTAENVDEYLKTNISMYDNRNKYFDTYLFNQKFDQYIKEKDAKRLLKQKVNLYDLDRVANIEVAPYQLPLDKLLIGLKNVWFQLFDDLINGKNLTDNFVMSNLFYYGITLIAIFILYIMLQYIFE